jgi:phosphoglycolate phosphatase-like HAD superfamily hydrolase
MLYKYDVVLWDFDGVILNSNSVRSLGFSEVLAEYPHDEVSRLLKFHDRNGGLSRYVKFRHFFEDIRGERITEEEVGRLARAFSEVMMKHLGDPALLIRDSVRYVKERHRSVRMHVVSGSDQRELRQLCAILGVADYFQSIHGSPTPKTRLVEELLSEHNYTPADCCLIGDSINDFEAARDNGIDFYGYNNPALEGTGTGYISAFAGLTDPHH